ERDLRAAFASLAGHAQAAQRHVDVQAQRLGELARQEARGIADAAAEVEYRAAPHPLEHTGLQREPAQVEHLVLGEERRVLARGANVARVQRLVLVGEAIELLALQRGSPGVSPDSARGGPSPAPATTSCTR